MIEFKDVSKIYDNNVKALANVNIKIEEYGERTKQ